MTFRKVCILVVSGVVGACAVLLLTTSLGPDPVGTASIERESLPGLANYKTLLVNYKEWEEEYTSLYEGRLAVNLVWNKSLSSEYSAASGRAYLDLKDGDFSILVRGLEEEISDVWLVDNVAGEERSTRPEPGDKLIRVGRMTQGEDGLARMEASIDAEQLKDFQLDWVVVAHQDAHPGEQGVLFGSVLLFQKLRHYADLETRQAGEDDVSVLARVVNSLVPPAVQAQGILPDSFPDADLINDGRDLFFFETFDGNGRTCGTCHPEENNLTIDPRFIATLPNNDPLFVAEFVPALMNNFEKPELMRKAALILENTNGFGDLANNFTMRGVPHTLGMRTSLEPPTAAFPDGTTVPPDERTGWSGDGSPLQGTLRDFAVGAVTQHFPKTLARQDGSDFRLPTEYELDAMEAFQLSMGRQEEFDDLNTITLTNESADQGRLNFMGVNMGNGTACNACHFNAGANSDPAVFGDSTNRSFGPRHDVLEDQPGFVIDPANFPLDDGFGSGTLLFNVPTVVEAADTGPFFHSNSIETVEGAVAFYTSQRVLRDGTVLPAITGLNGAQVANVGAFMRVINADENARSAIELITKSFSFAVTSANAAKRKINLRIARAEAEDAIEVLNEGRLHFADAVPKFKGARDDLSRAINTTSFNTRNFFMSRARSRLEDARELMINRP